MGLRVTDVAVVPMCVSQYRQSCAHDVGACRGRAVRYWHRTFGESSQCARRLQRRTSSAAPLVGGERAFELRSLRPNDLCAAQVHLDAIFCAQQCVGWAAAERANQVSGVRNNRFRSAGSLSRQISSTRDFAPPNRIIGSGGVETRRPIGETTSRRTSPR